MDNIEVDGYGNPFPPQSQQVHLAAVLAFIYKPIEEDKTIFVQPEWKDKSAGQYEKGSGV